MKTLEATKRRYLTSIVWGAALITLMTTDFAGAQLLLRVPADTPGPPVYTRTDLSDGSFAFHTDEWAAVVFYRAPDCVPDGFNLLAFYDLPDAFACSLTISGFELWDNGPGIDLAPQHTVSHGAAVPIWFVPWPALEVAIGDNVLTMPELESLGPLKGIATTFHEVLHPLGGPAKVPHLKITAQGLLLGGEAFQYHFNSVYKNKPKDNVKIEFR
jgi:hypothetical protein